MDFKNVDTCELCNELSKREGVEEIKIDPYEKQTVEVEGPMVILKIID